LCGVPFRTVGAGLHCREQGPAQQGLLPRPVKKNIGGKLPLGNAKNTRRGKQGVNFLDQRGAAIENRALIQ
jgi:hypothetical protein